MRAGRLRQRLVIEKDIGGADDSLGGKAENWVTFHEIRGGASFKGGKEFERAKQVIADISTLFVVRFDSKLAPLTQLHSMRVRCLDDNSILRILYADDPTRRRRQVHIYTNESQYQP